MTDQKHTITIFGSSRTSEQDDVFQLAEHLGQSLAEAGCGIANGGYGGTMLAAARGAARAGGTVTGVTCRAFKRSGPNEYITKEISTENLPQRLAKLIELGDAYIVLPGGTGTLLELADIWEHKNKGFANADKPIILIGAFWKPLVEIMAQADPKARQCIRTAETPKQVLQLLKETLK